MAQRDRRTESRLEHRPQPRTGAPKAQRTHQVKTCKYCPAELRKTNQCGMCRRCFYRVAARKRRGMDPDAPYTPRVRGAPIDRIRYVRRPPREKAAKIQPPPFVPKPCRQCPDLLKKFNRSGLCMKHWRLAYYTKIHGHPPGQKRAEAGLTRYGRPSSYRPGPRYHYCCGKCTTPYITNLDIPNSICPFCFARGVATPDKSQLSTVGPKETAGVFGQ